jgi:hypothetical protein
MPLIALSAMLAVSLVIVTDLTGRTGTLEREAVTAIEFVSSPPGQTLDEALSAACDVTGCDAALIGGLVRAGAEAMDEDALREALDDQALLLSEMRTMLELAPTGADAADIRLQLAAQERITALYRSELVTRAR